MTIRMRLLLWSFSMLVVFGTTVTTLIYLNNIYAFVPFQEAFMLSLIVITFFVIIAVFFVAHKISVPIRKLNHAALNIASGDYGKTISVEGPREISQLAQTLNTMSLCLEEQINRLRESSLVRERLYGEYECALLLQHHMLQKVVDDFTSSFLDSKLIKVFAATEPQGYFLEFDERDDVSSIRVAEAKETGFRGMFHLLRDRTQLEACGYPMTSATLKKGVFVCNTYHMASPIIWSTRRRALAIVKEREIVIEPGDFIFFYNRGFANQFHRHMMIQSWFGKVLRHFATESFDSFATVLTNELNFLTNKQHISDDMYILCLKVRADS